MRGSAEITPTEPALVRTSEGIVITVLHALDLLRAESPLVQCLTNTVAAALSANVLLAAGASPAMIDTPEEAEDFARLAAGVLVNMGTPTAARYEAMRAAVRGATDTNTPWVLDPVGAGVLSHRTRFVRSLLADDTLAAPAAIRGNASEILALGGGSGGRGVDAAHPVEEAREAARALAERTGAVVAVSGPVDLIVSPGRETRLTSGDPLLTRVSGTGCALGAVCAAYLGLGVGRHDAVLAAHAHLGAAAQIAARSTTGPGGFAAAWLDAVHHLTSAEIADLVSWKDQT